MVASNLAYKTEYRDYFGNVINDGSAKRRFVEHLHHDMHRGANIIRLVLETVEREKDEAVDDIEPRPGANTYASKSVDEVIAVEDILKEFEKPSVYVGVNSFCGFRRTVNACYGINAYYLDLDGHDLEPDILDAELSKVQHILNDEYNSGSLLVPSMITRTGRGYGIYYVLQRSIAARIPQTEGLRKYYDMLYGWLIKAYQKALENGGSKLSIDIAVTDRARVCRLPDTVNHRAGGEFCRLYDGEVSYYTMNQIKEGCHLENFALSPEEYHKSLGYDNKSVIFSKKDRAKENGKGLNKSNITDFNAYRTNNMIRGRIKFFYALQAARLATESRQYREELCFQLYNALVQVKDRDEAKREVREFNQRFSNPLPDKRLVSQTFASVDKFGCYEFANGKILQKLRVDFAQGADLGLIGSNKAKVREQAKQETKRKRKNREDIVISLKLAFPGAKREDLLQLVNTRLGEERLAPISIRTLDRILKTHGYGRPGTLAYDQTAEYKRSLKRKAGRMASKIKKLPNFAHEYCSVRGADAPAELVSESMGAVADTKSLLKSSGGVADDADRSVVADILSSFVGISGKVVQGVLVGQLRFSDRMVSTMVDAYEQLSTGMRIRMVAGLKLLSAVYMQSGDSSMLVTALNTMSLGITGTGRKHVDIQIGDDVVPYAVYRTGLIEPYSEWKAERDLERTRAEEQEAYDKQMQELQDAEDRYFEIMVRHMERLDVEPEPETRFGWLQMVSKDTGSKYHDIANVYRYLQINLKQSSSYASGCYRVGDAIYRGRDLWTALDCITLEDLKDTPIPGYDEAYDQVKDCPYEDFSAMAPDPVEWSDLVVLVVQHWLEIGKQHGGSDLERIQCSHPRKITTVAKYAKRA